MSEQPTVEEIAKVRRFECSVNGHTYSEVESMGSDGPTAVVCSNCGRTWRVCDPCTEADPDRLAKIGTAIQAALETADSALHARPTMRRWRDGEHQLHIAAEAIAQARALAAELRST